MRKDLEAICKTETSDFFFMVNNMNIRHNNCDPNDTTKYREEFATLSNQDKEEWYDIVYEQALALVVFQKQKDRNKKIKVYKQNNRE